MLQNTWNVIQKNDDIAGFVATANVAAGNSAPVAGIGPVVGSISASSVQFVAIGVATVTNTNGVACLYATGARAIYVLGVMGVGQQQFRRIDCPSERSGLDRDPRGRRDAWHIGRIALACQRVRADPGERQRHNVRLWRLASQRSERWIGGYQRRGHCHVDRNAVIQQGLRSS